MHAELKQSIPWAMVDFQFHNFCLNLFHFLPFISSLHCKYAPPWILEEINQF